MSEDMDDKDLREAFGEYFDGVQPPPASVTEQAKNQIRRQNARYKLVKRISVAAACVACACLVTVGVVYSPIIGIGGNKADSPGSDIGNSGNMNAGADKPLSPDASDGDNSSTGKIVYYTDSGLEAKALNVYGELPKGLNFVKTANLASNFAVTDLKGYYDGQNLKYAQTEITAHINGTRQEATVYAEYTAENSVCEIFEEFFDGEVRYYRKNYLLLNSVQGNGEWVSKIFMPTDGVKYYFTVKSSDQDAYANYLELIVSKK